MYMLKNDENEIYVNLPYDIELADWEEEAVDWLFWREAEELNAQQFSILRNVCDPRKFEVQKDGIPGGVGKTLEQRVNDDLLRIDDGTTRKIREWVNLACKKGLNIPRYLKAFLDKPDAETKSKGHLNHDPNLQEQANAFAGDFKIRNGRNPTRNEVAKELSKSTGLRTETIERRIRKKWGNTR
jgi:hypothetical protein